MAETKSKLKQYQKPENIINPDDELAIEVRGLKKYFKGKKGFEDVKAVDGISFNIKSGEIFGLLGPNGAGKTTTINMLIGLIKPTDGTASIYGYDIRENLSDVKELIGVCPQEHAVFKFLTGRENIELFGSLYSMPKEDLKKRADELISKLDFSNASKRKTKGYSGGMLSQLNLIISIINSPKITFLDEPTVGMDPRARRRTWEFIGNFKNERRTVLLTTHYIEEAQALCDRVAIIDYGELLDIGSPKDLMKKYESDNLEGVFMKITGRRIMEGM
ncbi:MAG: ATP-binding cassette domain-containing protein [Candidatus Lokiarchaeota archaeon]|nr:ATP-binding cassette domain-containing protein [Candidatus Lokiarchaeota archaeon]